MPKRGEPATPKQREALKRGQEKKRAMAEQAAKEDRDTAGERWAKLLDGTLTVQDLDDEEISKMKVRAKDGTLPGRGRKIPSHLAQQFHQEAIKRANAKFREALSAAVQTLADIATDPDVKEADRIKAANIIVDRVLGKAVETVRVEDTRWDGLLADAVGLDRDMVDED